MGRVEGRSCGPRQTLGFEAWLLLFSSYMTFGKVLQLSRVNEDGNHTHRVSRL